MFNTKNNELGNDYPNYCTCCDDVLKLFDYKGLFSRNYSLYQICNRRNFNGWSYIMMLEDDQFPIPLTEEEVTSFIKDPKKGSEFAHNIWMDRYR